MFLEGKGGGGQIWAKFDLKIRFFFHFLKFGSLVFLSLKQCLTSKGKIHKKKLGVQNWAENKSFDQFLLLLEKLCGHFKFYFVTRIKKSNH